MRIRYEPPDETFPINVTNMIDVFLLLLIFFLVATTFAKEERETKVQLPATAQERPISAPTRDLVINIMEDGTVIVAKQPLSGEKLQAKLRAALAEDPERNVLIRADERSFMKYFAGVARQCQQAGFNSLKVGYVVDKAAAATEP